MSVKVKTGTMSVRQKDGTMVGLNVLVGETADTIKAVESAGATQIDKIQKKGELIFGQIPDNTPEFTTKFNNLKSEVEGIRTGYDNTVYESAGEAVREQIKAIGNKIFDDVNTVHAWVKTGDGSSIAISLGESELITVVSLVAVAGSTINATFEYSDDVEIVDGGIVQLKEPISKVNFDTTKTASPDPSSKLNVLGGKYTFIKDVCYKIEDGVNFTWETIKSGYIDKNVLRCNAQKVIFTGSGNLNYGCALSTNRDEYPDDGVKEGFKYIYISTLGDIIASNKQSGEGESIDSKILGALNDLNTTDKSTIVNAINEVNNNVGTLSDLDTSEKTSLVGAVNENKTNIGTLDNLGTNTKSSVVSAVNEALRYQGDLSNLDTETKLSIVNAINEVVNNTDNMMDNVINAHMWKKSGNGSRVDVNLGNSEQITVVSRLTIIGATVNVTFEYSDSVGINDVGEVALLEPISKVNFDTTKTASPDPASKLDVLGGKYTIIKGTFYKIEDDVSFTWETVKGDSYLSNDVLRCNAQKVTVSGTGSAEYGYVLSNDRDDYPDDGAKGTFKYKYISTVGSLVASIQDISSGSDDTSNTDIGELSDLNTTDKTSIVNAINEVNNNTGTLSNLNTSAKTSIVNAINEVNNNTGILSNLNTSKKTSLVGAVNEVHANEGDLSSLNTSTKTSLVDAVNEVNDDLSGVLNKMINAYMWKKSGDGGSVSVSLGSTEKINLHKRMAMSGTGYSVTINYSNSVDVGSDGNPTLSEPISSVTYDDSTSQADPASKLDVLGGKYAIVSDECYKIEDGISCIVETIKSGYFDYYVVRCNAQKVTVSGTGSGEYGYVLSNDRSAYPDNDISGEFRYTYVGMVGDAIYNTLKTS